MGDINQCGDRIKKALNEQSSLFRMPGLETPGGGMNWTNAVPSSYQIVAGFIPGDWKPYRKRSEDVDVLLKQLRNWNTCREPQRKLMPNLNEGDKKVLMPLVAILHDWVNQTYQQIGITVQEIRDKGFVLIDFDRDRTVSNPDNYR